VSQLFSDRSASCPTEKSIVENSNDVIKYSTNTPGYTASSSLYTILKNVCIICGGINFPQIPQEFVIFYYFPSGGRREMIVVIIPHQQELICMITLTVVIWSCCIIVPTTMAASGLLQPARKS
jgi:hypothetical protein